MPPDTCHHPHVQPSPEPPPDNPNKLSELRFNLFQYLGADAVELLPDAKEVWLLVADHDVGDVGLLKAVHHTGGHRALGQMVLIDLDMSSESEKS